MRLKTLYIDVYFLINFTVDILALYCAARVSHIHTRLSRLILCAVIGSVSAIVDVFLDGYTLMRVALAVCTVLIIAFLSAPRLSLLRRIKLIAIFLTVMLLLCGLVTLGFSVIERVLGDALTESGGAENRNALVFSILILLSIGVIKLLIMLFSDMLTEKSVRLVIRIEDKIVEVEALVDSGNLVKDPMNMLPVIFIKQSVALRLMPHNVTELCDIDRLERSYRKRIRLIPISRLGQTHVMTGVRPDEVTVIAGSRTGEVDFTIAIDKEGGTYGGYEALAPSVVLGDVI